MMRARAKPANFGIASGGIALGCAEFVLAIVQVIVDAKHREVYARERELPEFVDLGGEA